MSDQLPPIVDIFNGINYNSQFFTSLSGSLTYQQATGLFLQYPNAQGNETSNYNFTINGVLNQNGIANFDDITTINGSLIANGTTNLNQNTYIKKPLDMTGDGTLPNYTSLITSSIYGFRDLTSGLITSPTISNNNNYLVLDNSINDSRIQFLTKSNLGVATNNFIIGPTLSIFYTPFNFNSTTPPTSDQISPLTSDNSNKIPTTAWVQSVLSGYVAPIPSYISRIASVGRNNITGNFILATFTISQIAWLQNEFLTLRIEYNMQWNKSLIIFNNQANQTTSTFINIYPYRFTTAWLNDGGGQAGAPRGQISTNLVYGANSAFGVIDALCPLGRQFWCNNWAYETTGTTGTATGVNSQLCICGHPTDINKFIIVVVNPNGYSVPTATFDFNLTVELINYGKSTLPIISTSGFDYNFTL